MSEAGQATFSVDRVYRYTLTRTWDGLLSQAAWIGLNPSTADENRLDPTMRRIMRFSRDFGFGAMVMLNLFGLRSTDPKMLKMVGDPVGRDNDFWIEQIASDLRVKLIVCAWGTHGAYQDRNAEVINLLTEVRSKRQERAQPVRVACLGTTKAGHPCHPLYLSSNTELEDFIP